MNEVRRIVTGKNENEYRNKSRLKALFGFFSDRIFDAKFKVNNFLINCSYESVKFSNETSMTEIKPVVMEKYEFENRDETLLVALLEFSDSFKSDARVKTTEFFCQISVYKSEVLD